ncbi:murein biosynthesis integral membrane protein MurJ [Candidatus Uhrbacteria bacterium]|nr:murein biosynthesis integral membrane protein MurJ [Candidatus Uhrbacteria bacterium]
MFRFLHTESKTIIGAAAIVGALSFVSRFVGFIRDRLLAGAFGAGDTLDVYYAAFKVPDLMFNLIVVGAISSSFIPLFSELYFGNRKEEAWKFTNTVLHILGLIMIVLSIILLLFSNPISALIAPGFNDVKREAVSEFMRVMLIAQVLLSFSMVFGSVLQSFKQFFLYSLAPIFYNIGIIFGALFFTKFFGPIGLAWGVVLGAFLHVLSQWIECRRSGYSHKFVFSKNTKEIKEMVRMTSPRMLGIVVNQLLFFILMIIATTLPTGSVTVFQFAYNIQFFPVGIIGVSFAIAAFPLFSEHILHDDIKSFRESFSSTIRQTLFLLIPFMLLFLILRSQIVRVVVGAGAFDWTSTVLTADTLAFFALTFIPQAFVFILARAFFALHDSITPLTAGLVGALIGIISAYLFSPTFGVVGLGMAYSLSAIINAVLLWVPLRQRIKSLDEASILQSIIKFAVSGLISGVVMQGIKYVLVLFLPLHTFFDVFFQGLVAGGVGLFAYFLIAWLLKADEMKAFVESMQKKILKKAQVDATQTLG